MELNFQKLPQIRISQLEKKITQRRFKLNENKRCHTQEIQPSLINGTVPYYINRNQTNLTNRVFNKCKCKCNGSDCRLSKYCYLRKKQLTDFENEIKNKMIRYKTEINQTKEQINDNKSQNKKIGGDFKKYNNFQYKQVQASKKLLKIVQKYVLTNYGKKIYQSLKIRGIIDKIIIQINKKSQKTGTSYFQENNKNLFQEIQKTLTSLKIEKELKIQKTSYDQLTLQNRKKTKLIKSKQTKTQIKIQQKDKIKNKGSKELNDGKKIKNPSDFNSQSLIDFINLVLVNDKSQITKFSQRLVEQKNITKFEQKMNQFQQLINIYENQLKVKKTINNILNQVSNKLEQQQLNSEQSQRCNYRKVEIINQLKKLNEIQQSDKKDLLQVPHMITNAKSKRKIKKTLKTFRNLSSQLSIDNGQRSSQKQHKLSLTILLPQDTKPAIISSPFISVNNVLQQIPIQKQKNKNSQNKIYEQDKNQLSQINQLDLVNFCLKYTNLSIKGNTTIMSNKRRRSSQIRQLMERQYQNQQIVIDERANTMKGQQKNQIFSVFKRQNQQQAQLSLKLKQQQKQTSDKQLNRMKKQVTTRRGVNKLKTLNMQNLIINDKDSILTKKLKINKIKKILQSQNGKKQSNLFSQVLAYVDMYQTQCKMLIGMNMNKSIVDTENASLKDEQNIIITKQMLNQQLKFIALSQDYFYGENQFTQNEEKNLSIFQIQQQIFKQSQKNGKVQTILPKEPVKQKAQLIQKQLPEKLKISLIKKIEKIQVMPKKKKLLRSQNKLKTMWNKFMQKTISDNILYASETKILLTQNSILHDKSSLINKMYLK